MATDYSVIYRTIGLQYLTVVVGIIWGHAARSDPTHVTAFWLAPATLSLIVLGIALFRSRRTWSAQGDATVSRLLIALIAYDALVMVFDPFVTAADEASCLLGVALIVVPLFCLKALVRRRAWLAAWGVVLFQATAVASLSCNFPAIRGGAGYFYIWVS